MHRRCPLPLFDQSCASSACPAFGQPVERYLPHWDTPDPPCPSCGGPTKREMSTFAVVFTGALTARYNDKRLENSHQDGHVAWERDATGKPRACEIKTWDDQREFCRRNHCANPKEYGHSYDVGEDGKTVKTPYSSGLGVEV